MSIEWVVGSDPDARDRAAKCPRGGLGTEEKVADIIIRHEDIVFEVKSGAGGIQQNKEQMTGLLQKGQEFILGVVVDPTAFSINLFLIQEKERVVYHHILKPISMETDLEDGLRKLGELLIFFNNDS